MCNDEVSFPVTLFAARGALIKIAPANIPVALQLVENISHQRLGGVGVHDGAVVEPGRHGGREQGLPRGLELPDEIDCGQAPGIGQEADNRHWGSRLSAVHELHRIFDEFDSILEVQFPFAASRDVRPSVLA